APEPELEPETIEPEPLPEPEVTEFEINAAAPEPVLENAESQHEELAREPEAAMAEPVAVEPEMIAEPEPVLESMDYAADAGPEAESQHEEPDHGPALTTPEPDIIEAIAEPAFEAASGLVSEPEPALEPLHEIVAAEPAGTEPGILEATAKPELSFETVAAEVLEPAAHEAEPIAVAANPEPVLDGEPAPLGEPIEEESVLYDEAEPVEAPVRFAPSTSAPLTIEMEHVSFAAPVQDENLDESPFLDELPTINLSANMIQSVPLPPRAAAAQMSAPAADPRRFEDAAVMRHPGQGGPGPRGFVWIETGRLAATPMPGLAAPIEQDLDMLKDAGVTMLITLTEQDFPQNLLVRHGLRNLHFPIADQKAPSTGDTDMLVTQMRDLLGQGEILAVHCLAGLGRTGTILAAYMVREQGLSAQAALNQIRHFNRQFVQTDDQEDFLMEYEVQQEQIQLRNRATGSGAKLLK
ncbi:MAG TPA: dual specificity protein phosphatase family protein, partial [Acidocella sp.]|nr:dual specificity protein phosphatase family protein [Acidocella sp.]